MRTRKQNIPHLRSLKEIKGKKRKRKTKIATNQPRKQLIVPKPQEQTQDREISQQELDYLLETDPIVGEMVYGMMEELSSVEKELTFSHRQIEDQSKAIAVGEQIYWDQMREIVQLKEKIESLTSSMRQETLAVASSMNTISGMNIELRNYQEYTQSQSNEIQSLRYTIEKDRKEYQTMFEESQEMARQLEDLLPKLGQDLLDLQADTQHIM